MSSEAVSHPEGGAGIKRRPADGKKVLFARIRIETYQQILALAGDKSLGAALDDHFAPEPTASKS